MTTIYWKGGSVLLDRSLVVGSGVALEDDGCNTTQTTDVQIGIGFFVKRLFTLIVWLRLFGIIGKS